MKLPTQIVALTFSLVELARAWSIGWMNPKEDIVLLKQAGPTVMSMGPGGHKQAADVKMLLYEALGRQIKALHAKEKALHVKEVLSDRPEMEKLLKQRIGLTPDPVSDHFALACFHDRIGRDADALAEWKIASHPQVRVYASILSDPAVLSHYGDISLRLGDRVFAYEMYESAGCPVLRSNDFGDLDIPSDPIETMKHAAHYHAAEEKITHGDLAGALEDFKMALPLLHCSVNGRLSYGRLLVRLSMIKEAKVEFRTAEAMAPDDPTKLSIHTERVRLGLIKTVSVSVIAKGKLTNYVKELPDKD